MAYKRITAAEAASMIQNGENIGLSGFTPAGTAKAVTKELAKRAQAEHDAGREFQDCMGDTELAHLLEHLTVEIMNQTGLAGDISFGRTRGVAEDPRLFDIELGCPDDALTIGALSSAAFMMQWAFVNPDAPAPDFEGTVAALTQLVSSLRGEGAPEGDESAAEEPAEDVTEDVAANEEVAEPLADEAEDAPHAEGIASDAVFGGAAAAHVE